MADLSERLAVMLEQESDIYRTRDYLDESHQQMIAKQMKDRDLFGEEMVGSSVSVCTSDINELWREKICEWQFQVVDHFGQSRDVVSVALNYLDRFLQTKVVNKKVFQLAAMTSLFLAIKLFEPGRIGMSSMIELSRGYFSVEQMQAMEMAMLRTLKWRVHPPTAYTFVKYILSSVPCVTITMKHNVLELARFLTELSVIDYFFVVHKPSDVAVASIVISLEILGGSADQIVKTFVEEMTCRTGLDAERSEVEECCNRLHRLYIQGGYNQGDAISDGSGSTNRDGVSPVCVSHGVITVSREYASNRTEPED